jgi:hypothetical protein
MARMHVQEQRSTSEAKDAVRQTNTKSASSYPKKIRLYFMAQSRLSVDITSCQLRMTKAQVQVWAVPGHGGIRLFNTVRQK